MAGAVILLALTTTPPSAAEEVVSKPNVLVIMADDIGYWNISAYNRGMMGYRTPNIDRIANEGAIFTDYYGQQSCTAGRAAFITGQSPMRTGLLKVGLPGAKEGLSEKDPTLADLLKPLGYMTGQFGKNHLGDRNEFLPTVHGFDEFFGNLYHLNAEDEPEHPEYPKGTEFKLKFGPRGVLRCTATTADTPGEDPRFGKWAKQNCEDTGPLDKKRMETVDQELWHKGATSGNTQKIVSMKLDCDRDALVVLVHRAGPACHTGEISCFNESIYSKEGAQSMDAKLSDYQILMTLEEVIAQREKERPEGAYTTYLFEEGVDKILKKVGEEATEVVIAAKNRDPEELKWEASDLIYHLMVLLREQGLPFKEVLKVLEERHLTKEKKRINRCLTPQKDSKLLRWTGFCYSNYILQTSFLLRINKTNGFTMF